MEHVNQGRIDWVRIECTVENKREFIIFGKPEFCFKIYNEWIDTHLQGVDLYLELNTHIEWGCN